MQPLVLKLPEARRIILHAAGLSRDAAFGREKEAVYKAIRHLGYVQLDTNHTVERAHHHTLFSRIPDYRLEWLRELQNEGRIYEFLTSDSGYMPMENVRFSIPAQQSFEAKYAQTPQQERNGMQRVLDRIEREGPLMLQDFENDRTEASSGWWDWRPAKIFLERLYLSGRVMVTRDEKFHKRYDVPLNIIPAGTDRTPPSAEEFARHIIRFSLTSLGIAGVKEMAWRCRFVKQNQVKTEVEKLAEEGEILRVTVEGLKSKQLYMLPFYRGRKITLSPSVRILSPFDPLNVFRHRLKDFFHFDYQIECFVPEPKRMYGYFSLPVLIGDRFIARMDTKADRKTHTLQIHNLHFEEGALTDDELLRFSIALSEFATFNQCFAVHITRCNRKPYWTRLKQELKKVVFT